MFDVAFVAERGRYWDLDRTGPRFVEDNRLFMSLIYRFARH
jgi:hypothetical protein